MICTHTHTYTRFPVRVWTLNSWGLVATGIGISRDPRDAWRIHEHAYVMSCHRFAKILNHIERIRGNWIKKECASLQLIQLIFMCPSWFWRFFFNMLERNLKHEDVMQMSCWKTAQIPSEKLGSDVTGKKVFPLIDVMLNWLFKTEKPLFHFI